MTLTDETMDVEDFEPVLDVKTKKKPKKSQQEKAVEQVLANLAALGGRMNPQDEITFHGDKLILPATMNIPDAIKALKRKQEAEEQEVNISRVYHFRPLDGAYALHRVIHDVFGLVQHRGHLGMFGIEMKPQFISVAISAQDKVQVPWGRFELAHLPGAILSATSTMHEDFGFVFQIACTTPAKWRSHIEGIFDLVQSRLEKESIYRGKAVNGATEPEFLDLSAVDPDKVIYSDEVVAQIDANIWSLLKYTDTLRHLGEPLKRAVLLEGPFGTGKTLAAFLTAQVAEQNGWTFIYCRPAKDDLEEVMKTAQLYQPAVVFYEDIDTAAGAGATGDGATDDRITRLLDVFDGISAKGTEIVCILTTNHADRIHKGMVRPGRLDSVIHIGALDVNGIKRMVTALVEPDLLSPVSEDEWVEIHEAMTGYMPAFVREAIGRAVRYSMSRNHGAVGTLNAADFVKAAQGLRPQFELMEGASEGERADDISTALRNIVSQQTKEALVLLEEGHELYRANIEK